MNDFARTTISLLAAGLAALNACAAAADGNALAPLKPHPRLFADMEGFRAAKIWLAQHPDPKLSVRFDVIEVYLDPGEARERVTRIEHIRAAFYA